MRFSYYFEFRWKRRRYKITKEGFTFEDVRSKIERLYPGAHSFRMIKRSVF